MSLDWLPGLDLPSGTFTVPLWAVGVAAALVLALLVIAVTRTGLSEFGGLVFRTAIVVLAVVFGWTYINRASERDRAEERRALDHRSVELVGHALAPGSAMACLEATNTETVEGSCERAVFASPESVAAATAYISARLSLLTDAHEFTARRDQSYESQIAGLRRTIAADRFGLASQVLATRDGCTADACDAFGLVYDDKKLRANMKDRLFDMTVGRYAVNWPARSARPVMSSAPSSAPATPIAPPGPNVQFPSSQSIPPVSIMNAEPERSPAPPPPAPPAQAATSQPDAPTAPTNSAPASATKKSAAPPPRAAAKKNPSQPMSLNPDAK